MLSPFLNKLTALCVGSRSYVNLTLETASSNFLMQQSLRQTCVILGHPFFFLKHVLVIIWGILRIEIAKRMALVLLKDGNSSKQYVQVGIFYTDE